MNFEDLGLHEPLLRALDALSFTTPTPIQAQAIPHVRDGRDLLGIAQTGTGKTAAFALPTLHRLLNAPRTGRRTIRVLVLAPTRELAAQIGDTFASLATHTQLTHTVIFGGVGAASQKSALRTGVDILVATPGRCLDLMDQGFIDLRHVETFILDEADRMLDMGFVHDVRKVVSKLPSARQTLLFSATMPSAIVDLSKSLLRDPVRVEVTPQATTVERIRQHVLFVEKDDKRALLALLVAKPQVRRAIVFTRTKHGADRVVKHLMAHDVHAAAIHGNKSQNARERSLGGFRDGKVRVLVATDIAARGIDVEDITHVINFDLPNVPEQYVHRIGRTARAGSGGIALSFCDLEERAYLKDIEKLIQQPIPEFTAHPFPSPHPPGTPIPKATKPQGRSGPRPQRAVPANGDRGGRPGRSSRRR